MGNVNDAKIKLVNELLDKIQPLLSQLNNELKDDHRNYNRIVWDIEALDKKRDKTRQDIGLLEQQIEIKKQQGESILAMAKEEADKILNVAREKNLEAERNRAEAKKVLEEAFEKKHKQEKVIRI